MKVLARIQSAVNDANCLLLKHPEECKKIGFEAFCDPDFDCFEMKVKGEALKVVWNVRKEEFEFYRNSSRTKNLLFRSEFVTIDILRFVIFNF